MITTHEELYHHGIKGMRWGVRRYQNKDGSLTDKGKKRYGDVDFKKETSEVAAAKANRKVARKAFNKAYNRYNLVPTKQNSDAYDKALNDLNKARTEYKGTKFRLNTSKEMARLNQKSIDLSNKSKHRQRLEEQYQKKGLSQKEAEAAANNRIRTEKILATAAAVTVTACAAYAANKYYKNRVDGLIKAGSQLQRIEMRDTGSQLHDTFYAASGKHDTKRYKAILGYTRQKQTGQAYLMKLKANSDIKVASKEKATAIFEDLYKNDSDFRSAVEKHVGSHFSGKNAVDTKNTSRRNIRKMYENFNSALIDIREGGSGADAKFYSKLKSSGYGAIQDINDMKFSGYKAKNPLIVFGNSKSKNIMVESASKIGENMYDKAIKESAKASVEQSLEKYGPLTAASLSVAAATTYAKEAKVPDYKNRR